MAFTYADLCFLERCLTRMQVSSEQAAKDFRCEPVSEDIARAYDQDAARCTALLARLDDEIQKVQS
jgi:hypothetical protein